MSLDTTNWVKYPFTVDGVDFVSMLDTEGSMYSQVKNLPAGLFTTMNAQAIRELIGNASLFSTAELQAELDKLNEGASQAILALA